MLWAIGGNGFVVRIREHNKNMALPDAEASLSPAIGSVYSSWKDEYGYEADCCKRTIVLMEGAGPVHLNLSWNDKTSLSIF